MAEELPSVLWAYRTTPRRSTSATPFSLAYGMEAVIPLEVGLPTLTLELCDQRRNDSNVARELDFAEEQREATAIHLTAYQQRLARGYNQKVKARRFAVGELVLKKTLPGDRNPNEGKLAPNWQGPYKVLSTAGRAACRLEDMEARSCRDHGTQCISKSFTFENMYLRVQTAIKSNILQQIFFKIASKLRNSAAIPAP